MKSAYALDGVDVPAGDAFSAFAGGICAESYGNSPFVQVTDLSSGNFRGPRGWKLVGLPDLCFITNAADGVGTKVVIAGAAGMHGRIASDLVAMVAMDITRYGGLPLVLSTILDVRSLGGVDSEAYRKGQEIMLGLGEIARRCNYVILNGETAELGPCVGSEIPDATLCFNWGACMTGVYHPDKMILGNTLAPGQVIIAFRENGFRSNGMSSVRKALAMRYGDQWWRNEEAATDIALCAIPSVQYDGLLNYLHGWSSSQGFRPLVKLHFVAHLTGGAFKGKLADVLRPLGLCARLDCLFDPPEIMLRCAKWRGMSPVEFHEVWNGGQGALVVVDENDADTVISQARTFGIDAQVAGDIIPRDDCSVSIRSNLDGSLVEYE